MNYRRRDAQAQKSGDSKSLKRLLLLGEVPLPVKIDENIAAFEHQLLPCIIVEHSKVLSEVPEVGHILQMFPALSPRWGPLAIKEQRHVIDVETVACFLHPCVIAFRALFHGHEAWWNVSDRLVLSVWPIGSSVLPNLTKVPTLRHSAVGGAGFQFKLCGVKNAVNATGAERSIFPTAAFKVRCTNVAYKDHHVTIAGIQLSELCLACI